MLATIVALTFTLVNGATAVPQLFPVANASTGFNPTVKLIGLPFTAMHANGSLNLAAVREQAEYAQKQSLDFVLIQGTTGEWPELGTHERIALFEAWRAAVPKSASLKILAHVGAVSLNDARILAQRMCAEGDGADGVLMAPPVVFQPTTVELLVESLRSVLVEECAKTPAYFYHYPMVYSEALLLADILTAAADRIPNLMGAKYAGGFAAPGSIDDFIQSSTAGGAGRFSVFNTGDVCLPSLPSSPTCSHGPATILYTYEGVDFRDFVTAVHEGNITKILRKQTRIDRRRSIIGSFNQQPSPGVTNAYQITGAKALANIIGLPVGASRLPMPTLNKTSQAKLAKQLVQEHLMPHYAKSCIHKGETCGGEAFCCEGSVCNALNTGTCEDFAESSGWQLV